MAKKRTKRTYSEYDHARIAVALQSNMGNQKKTARELGIPLSTVRSLRQKWDINGYPEMSEDILERESKNFVEEAEALRWEIFVALWEKVKRRDLTGKDLITALAMLTDKITVMSGGATTRTEHIEKTTLDSRELAKDLAEFINESVEMAKERADAIKEIQKSEQADKPALRVIKGDK